MPILIYLYPNHAPKPKVAIPVTSAKITGPPIAENVVIVANYAYISIIAAPANPAPVIPPENIIAPP